ncbi:MAG TPA: hypothetical protein VFK40_00040 [Nitrososphaeraceae archaeon]|nr:hypothetical protein [Nitrososphaeraceae archaeon]
MITTNQHTHTIALQRTIWNNYDQESYEKDMINFKIAIVLI